MARLVEFEILGGVTTPEQFWEAVEEIEDELIGTWPILINGRGPQLGDSSQQDTEAIANSADG